MIQTKSKNSKPPVTVERIHSDYILIDLNKAVKTKQLQWNNQFERFIPKWEIL